MITKKWRIRCKCGHEFYVPYIDESLTKKVKGFLGLGKVMCTACGGKRTEVVELIEKKKRE